MTSSGQLLLRTLFLTLGTWSLGTLLVVEAGLGARYSLHPDAALDPAAVPSVSLRRGEDLLGPISAFDVIGQRPLFNIDRRPIPVENANPDAGAPPAAAAPLNVVLTSVVIMGEDQIAIVSDPASNTTQTVRVGKSLEGEQAAWRLLELGPRRAVFEGPGGRTALELRVFDGQGGQPPTPITTPTAQANPANPGGVGGSGGVIQESKEEGSGAVGADSPESRAEQIRRRIEERRRQMREDAERANAERGQ